MSHPGFKFLALIVDLAQAGEVGFGLVLEEGVMQHLVVDVQLAHLGLHAIPLLLLQLLVLFLLLQCTEQGQQPGMHTVPSLLRQWTERGQQSGLHAVPLLLLQVLVLLLVLQFTEPGEQWKLHAFALLLLQALLQRLVLFLLLQFAEQGQ